MPPTPEFLADRYRETTSAARLMWDAPYDLKLHRWLHRLTMPTLILWGDDRLIPSSRPRVGRSSSRRRGQDPAGRGPSHVRRESRGRRRAWRFVGEGLTVDPRHCALAHICAHRAFEGTVSAP
jgi:hypothetical protein